MNTLDLHGIRHHEVERRVEDFVLLNGSPLKIITGNSSTMKAIVEEVLQKYDLRSEPESDYNLGAIIVYEFPT